MNSKSKNQHELTFNIFWGDMDALGHVNNVRYFDYFQEARIEWLKQLNIRMTEDTGPVVAQVACNFLKPIFYPATLTIKSQAHTPGRSSLILDHCIYQGEELMAQGTSTVVWMDYKKKKSIALPDLLRLLLAESD